MYGVKSLPKFKLLFATLLFWINTRFYNPMFNFYNSTLRQFTNQHPYFKFLFFFITGTAKARYFFCNSVKKHSIEMSRIFSTERTPSRSNWNLEMLVLKTEEKPEVPGENPLGARREPTTKPIHPNSGNQNRGTFYGRRRVTNCVVLKSNIKFDIN